MGNKQRVVRWSDEDWESVTRAAEKMGLTPGQYLLSLHKRWKFAVVPQDQPAPKAKPVAKVPDFGLEPTSGEFAAPTTLRSRAADPEVARASAAPWEHIA